MNKNKNKRVKVIFEDNKLYDSGTVVHKTTAKGLCDTIYKMIGKK